MKIQRGFTLIELLITITVLAIIATVSAPNLQSAIKKREIESTGSDFEKLLGQSRADAALFRKDITVHIQSTGIDTSTDRYWSLGEDVVIAFKEGVCSDEGNWSNEKTLSTFNKIVFSPQGNVKDLPNNLEIQINNDYEKKYIYVTNLGRITTSKTSIFEGAC